MQSQILQAKPIPLAHAPDMQFDILIDDGHTQVVRIRAKPGATLPMHSHGESASMHVLRGKAKILAAEGDRRNTIVLNPGEGVEFGADEPHGYIADELEGFESHLRSTRAFSTRTATTTSSGSDPGSPFPHKQAVLVIQGGSFLQ